MPTQNISDQLLVLVNLYEHVKSSFFRYCHFLSPVARLITKLTLKIFNRLLICVNLCLHAKNQSIPSVHSGDAILECRDQIGHTPFSPCPTKKESPINF